MVRLLCLVLLFISIVESTIPILRDLATAKNRFVGSCSNHAYLSTDANYTAVLAQQYSIVTPENEMKWGATEAQQGVFTFEQGDMIVAYAQKANQHVRGHNLCWGVYNPTWLTSGNFTGTQLQAILQNHINNVVAHYKGQLYSWDVVNEAVSDSATNTSYLKPSVWYPAVPNYVDLAFQFAREADPNVKLFYNDYGAEEINAKSNAVYNMLKSMKERGIPVDGVGLQYHVSLGWYPNITSVIENIQRLSALGLEVHITEMDVGCTGNATQQVKFAEQAKIYQPVLAACLSAPQCAAYVTWGFTDKYTWLGSDETPLPFDINYNPKPAFYALAEDLS